MIRTVPSGDIGLDVILGGGWRLIERLPGRESATVVIRGGPGTGKTLLAVDVALSLAGALKGDVVVACVEILPSEYFAQIEASRAELVLQHKDGPALNEPVVILLPADAPVLPCDSPRIFCGLLPSLDSAAPDLVAALESMQQEVARLNGKPAAFIVDSLIAGYGLGPESPRENVDAVMKFAAQGGFGLVLCQETIDDTSSVWDFAADTLLALDNPREGARQIVVRKHRYGASAAGVHQLEIRGWGQPRVYPRPDAWLGMDRVWSALPSYGWRRRPDRKTTTLCWIGTILGQGVKSPKYRSEFAFVSGPNLGAARRIAYSLSTTNNDSARDLVVELDPISFQTREWASDQLGLISIPVAAGASHAICELVKYLGKNLFGDDNLSPPRRILLGDVGSTGAFVGQTLWADAIGVIAAHVEESGSGIPLIAYSSASLPEGLASLRWRPDLVIETSPINDGRATSRHGGSVFAIRWSTDAIQGPWPPELAHLSEL